MYAKLCYTISSQKIEFLCKSKLDHSVQRNTFRDVMVRRTQDCFLQMRAGYEESVRQAHFAKSGNDVEKQKTLHVAKEQFVTISQ